MLPVSPADLRAGSGNTTEPLQFPWGGGSGTAVAAAYVNTQDLVCMVMVRPSGKAAASGCTPPALLSRRLDDGVAYILGVSSDEAVVVTGYVAAEIDRIAVRGPQGPLDVRLSGAWTPPVEGAEALRAFVATTAGLDGGDVDVRDGTRLLDPANYSIEAQLPDGRSVTVRP
jgi:hypothetical protein